MEKKTVVFLLIFIIFFGLILRIYGLGRYDFWYDEAVSFFIAQGTTLPDIFIYGKYFSNPPFFNFLLKNWMALGKSEFILRFLPLAFGLLSITSIYLVGKLLFNERVGLIAAFLLSISPFHVYYSQELSGYSLIALLTLLTIFFFIRILKHNTFFSWIGFIVSNILCLYTHNIFLLILLTENFYFFYNRIKKLYLKWMISQLIIVLFYLPWFTLVLHQLISMSYLSSFFWVPKPSLGIILHTFNVFNLGYSATKMTYFYFSLIFFLLFFLGVWKSKKLKRENYLLLFWLFVPMIMAILISKIIKEGSIYLYRVFISISPAYYIMVARGLDGIKKRSVSLIILSTVIILSLISLKNYYNNIYPLPDTPYRLGIFTKKENKPAADYISDNLQNGEIILHTSRSTLAPFKYYHNNKLTEKWVLSYNNPNYEHWRKFFYYHWPLPLVLDNTVDIRVTTKKYRRFWLVLSGWAIHHQESPEIKEWCDKNAELIDNKEYRGIKIFLYQMKS